ncbi:uncharacterized protein LOC18425632 isoform X1 [Amborella trichopoda]|uniref:uncharacterized protein LOC18425632 isoform X1 n=1 Tax=Amborella trichopoda TaxID=13333 RepID=UPI0005D3288A|nr:uncharacterized protein LOC18425632 isoform X1 [Amborella trichopoda]|eukprot:XP_011629369.1 uncharacterized protein LOC18425632 isoform X1 [Amborella trichopoda]
MCIQKFMFFDMKYALFFSLLLVSLSVSEAYAAPVEYIVRPLYSLFRWMRASPKASQNDGNFLQFENGYVVETVVEGNKLGIVPYVIRISPEGELIASDTINSNIVRMTPPLSPYSRARLVAGSFQGHLGHVDGKPSDARFNHPKGVAVDDRGNVYVADTLNMAIRKIGEAGVTTIAGGKSNAAGYSDGPSEDAKFSSDFDVVYVGSTCSLLVIDRGNAALREIALRPEDCSSQYSSVSSSDIIIVAGALLVGYVSCFLHQGFSSSNVSKQRSHYEDEWQEVSKEEKTKYPKDLNNFPVSTQPSFFGYVSNLLGFLTEKVKNIYHSIPFLRPKETFLSPLDNLVMPEDDIKEAASLQKQRSSWPMTESIQSSDANNSYTSKYKASSQKKKSSGLKDPNLPCKHKSRRQDAANVSGSAEASRYVQHSSKSQRHHRSREATFGASEREPKPMEIKSVDYGDPKFDHYNIRSKFTVDNVFQY